MAPQAQEVEQIIRTSLARLREDIDLPPISSMTTGTAILGGDSDLDSMAVVHLIVDLESRLEAQYQLNWILADERALSRRRSPFRTIGDLRDFILETTPES